MADYLENKEPVQWPFVCTQDMYYSSAAEWQGQIQTSFQHSEALYSSTDSVTMKIEDVSEQQVFLLAAIFRHPASEQWVNYAERVYSIEPQLDRVVLRPDLLHRFVQPPQSRYTPLCSLHKILDARIVHAIFLLVVMEVGVRLNRLMVAGRDELEDEIWDRSILNLRSLHGAWLHPEVFWDTFGATLDVPKGGCSDQDYMAKWVREEDKCEACVLSRIGGDFDTVLDLRMAVNSRIHTRSRRKYRQPRLARVIEGWVHAWKPYFTTREWQTTLETNDANTAKLKIARRKIAKQKRSTNADSEQNTQRGRTYDRPAPAPSTRDHGGSVVQREQGSKKHESSHRQSTETIKVYLSPSPIDHKAGADLAASDGEEEHDIRQTVYNTENEIIDCYASLISTPFLPGMGSREHHKRATLLSRHCSTINNPNDDRSWPMVGPEKAQKQLIRSQSTTYRRPSNYGESVYSQDPTILNTTNPSKERLLRASKSLARSYSVQDKRYSDGSWVTASVPPSTVTTHVNSFEPEHRSRSTRNVSRTEVPQATSSRSKGTRFRDITISPIHEEVGTRNGKISTHGRSGRNSPVSPLTPIASSSSARRTENRNYSIEGDAMTHVISSRTGSKSRDHSRNQDRSQPGRTKSRSSKPLEGPVFQGRRPSRFSEHFNEQSLERRAQRDRDTVLSDTTHWSDLYWPVAEDVEQLGSQFRVLNVEAEPNYVRKRRGK